RVLFRSQIDVCHFCRRAAPCPGCCVQHRKVRQAASTPPLRNQPQRRFLELGGEQRRRGGVHAFGLAAIGLGAHRVEVDEPALEQGLGDGFEGGVGLAQEVGASLNCCQQSYQFHALRCDYGQSEREKVIARQ